MYTGKSVCLKCGHVSKSGRIYEDCSYCRIETLIPNIAPVYEPPKTDGKEATFLRMLLGNNMEAYRELLLFRGNQSLADLGVRNTALTRLPTIGKKLGLDLYIKDKTRNPTWGHKDRLNAVLINKAMELGVSGVAYASTGSNGTSGVALAAKAGAPCMVLTIKRVDKTLETFMQVHGVKLVGVKTVSERREILKYLINQCGWYPVTDYVTPIVDSSSQAIEGHKLIVYGLYKQVDEPPDKIVIPIYCGDALLGTMRGFSGLKEMGFTNYILQMASVEDYGSVVKAYNSRCEMIESVKTWDSVAFSISAKWSKYHSLYALRKSRGLAIALGRSEDFYQVQSEPAQKEGAYCGSAPVVSYVGLGELVIGRKIREGEKVALLIITSGVKSTKVTPSYLSEFPESITGLDEASDILEEQYQMRTR